MGKLSLVGSKTDRNKQRDAAVEFIRRIDDMIESGKYEWAMDTIAGIRERVEQWESVTQGQKEAIDNIEYSVDDSPRRR